MNTSELIAVNKLIKQDNFISIRDLQKSPTKSLSSNSGVKFIMNNGKPMGIYMSYEEWNDLLEDIEALGSAKYIKNIAEARKGKKTYSRENIIEKFNLNIA